MSAFVRFDPNTKLILSHGIMDMEFIEEERRKGISIETIDEPFLSAYGYENYFDPATKKITSVAIPEQIPEVITITQFYQEAASRGYIRKDEALEAMRNKTIPAPFRKAIDSIEDEDERFNLEMRVYGMTTISKQDSFIVAITNTLKISESSLNSFFASASKL